MSGYREIPRATPDQIPAGITVTTGWIERERLNALYADEPRKMKRCDSFEATRTALVGSMKAHGAVRAFVFDRAGRPTDGRKKASAILGDGYGECFRGIHGCLVEGVDPETTFTVDSVVSRRRKHDSKPLAPTVPQKRDWFVASIDPKLSRTLVQDAGYEPEQFIREAETLRAALAARGLTTLPFDGHMLARSGGGLFVDGILRLSFSAIFGVTIVVLVGEEMPYERELYLHNSRRYGVTLEYLGVQRPFDVTACVNSIANREDGKSYAASPARLRRAHLENPEIFRHTAWAHPYEIILPVSVLATARHEMSMASRSRAEMLFNDVMAYVIDQLDANGFQKRRRKDSDPRLVDVASTGDRKVIVEMLGKHIADSVMARGKATLPAAAREHWVNVILSAAMAWWTNTVPGSFEPGSPGFLRFQPQTAFVEDRSR